LARVKVVRYVLTQAKQGRNNPPFPEPKYNLAYPISLSIGLLGGVSVVIFRRGNVLASPWGSKDPQLLQLGNNRRGCLVMTEGDVLQ